MKIREYADREQMMMGVANAVAGDLTSALLQHGEVLMAVPGGTTPGPAFDCLSGVSLEWERVSITLTDERWVPETSPRSNARLVRERLLVDKAAKARFIPFYRDGGKAEDHLAEISTQIDPLLPISVAVLGMGEDMHTASLFPGSAELATALSPEAATVLAVHPDGSEETRVTLSAHVLNGAFGKHLVITGAEKRASLEKARSLRDPMQAPVYAILDGATVHWAA